MAKKETKEVKETKETKEIKGLESLSKLIANVEKKYGKGLIGTINTINLDIPKISSNIMSLDYALDGGFPKGRIVEMYGESSAGKTSLSLHTIAQSQKEGGRCAFIDAENSFDPVQAKRLGVDLDSLLIVKSQSGEMAFDVLHELVKSNMFSVVVVDSVSAITPTKLLESEMGENFVGLHARLVQQGILMLNNLLINSQTLVIFINQLRSSVQVAQWGGDTNVTTGGRSLVFYSSQRLEVKKSTTLKDSDNNPIGYLMKINVKKNKVGMPLRVGEINYYFKRGFSMEDEVLDMGMKYGIIEKSGSWFRYEDTQLAQGREKTLSLLEDNPELMEEISKKVKEAHTKAMKGEDVGEDFVLPEVSTDVFEENEKKEVAQ